MFSAVPTSYLESLDNQTTNNVIVAPRRPKTASSIVTTKSTTKIRKVKEFTEEESKDLMLMLVKNNRQNTDMNLKSQNYKVLITNEHINSELCQIL
jgi:hypothetical protein